MAKPDDEYLVMQFLPCGCVYRMKRSDIIVAGAGKQLEDPDKFDAPILPSSMCEQCNEDQRMQDERTARMLDEWSLK